MSDPREFSRTTFAVALFLVCLLLSRVARATPSITLSKKSGPPTSKILVSGSGFEANVGVDIYFDTTDEALVVTNGKGEFDNAKIHAPRSARPGKHWVTALERNNDKGAQKPFLVQTDWSQFRFDADGTRLNPYENVINRKTLGNLELKWTFATAKQVVSSPVVINGVVYVGSSDGKVYALNARTGNKLWSYLTDGEVWSAPAVADGVVYVGSASVYALNANTGHILWKYSPGGGTGWSAPVVANGVVYVGSSDYTIYALDAGTGARVWSYTAQGPLDFPPALAEGVVYVGSVYDDHTLYALNARTGGLLWSYAGPWGYNIDGPSVANEVVYVGSYDGNVYALNASTGTLLWTYTASNVVFSTPAVANGVVYVGSWDDNVYALDASSGAKLWSFHTNSYIWSSPSVANGVVYVGSEDDNVYALDRFQSFYKA